MIIEHYSEEYWYQPTIHDSRTLTSYCRTSSCVVRSLSEMRMCQSRSNEGLGGSLLGPPVRMRYFRINTPSGLVHGLRYSEDEINAAVERLFDSVGWDWGWYT